MSRTGLNAFLQEENIFEAVLLDHFHRMTKDTKNSKGKMIEEKDKQETKEIGEAKKETRQKNVIFVL